MNAVSHSIAPINTAGFVMRALEETDTITLVLEQAPQSRLGLSIIATNNAFDRAFGYPPGACAGWGFDILAGPDSDAGMIARIKAAATAETRLEGELFASTRSGGTLWFGFHLMPVSEGQGRFVVIGRDITAKLLAGRAERAVNQLLAAVFARVDAAVIICDERDVVRMVNPALGVLLGRKADTLLGHDVGGFMPPLVHGLAPKLSDKLKPNGESAMQERDVRLADDSKLRCRVTASLVELPDKQRFVIATVARADMVAGTKAVTHVAGRLCLIGLESVRAALGERWQAMADRALDVAESVLKRRLDPAEVFSRTDDHSFIVRFAGADENEHAFRAAIIAREIEAKLIGQGEDPAAATITAVVEKLPPALAATDDASLADTLNQRLKARALTVEKQARQTLVSAASEAVCVMHPVAGYAGGPRPTNFAVAALPVGTQREIGCAFAVLPPALREDFDLDMLLMTLAIDQTSQDLMQSSGRISLIPVGYESFATRKRSDRFLDNCRALDNVVRHHVMFLLGPLPPTISASRAAEIVGTLRQFSKGVALRLDAIEPPKVDLAQNAIQIVAVAAEEALQPPPARITKMLQHLAIRKAKLLVTDVPDTQAAERLNRLGVGLLTMRDSSADAQVS